MLEWLFWVSGPEAMAGAVVGGEPESINSFFFGALNTPTIDSKGDSLPFHH